MLNSTCSSREGINIEQRGQHGGAGGDNNHLTPSTSASTKYCDSLLVPTVTLVPEVQKATFTFKNTCFHASCSTSHPSPCMCTNSSTPKPHLVNCIPTEASQKWGTTIATSTTRRHLHPMHHNYQLRCASPVGEGRVCIGGGSPRYKLYPILN